jgi:hypothetical protein
MGRMKEIYIELLNANGGIPPDMTVADMARMREMEVYNWEQYEREQEKIRLQHIESENSGEAGKMEQVTKKFSAHYGQAREEKGGEQ